MTNVEERADTHSSRVHSPEAVVRSDTRRVVVSTVLLSVLGAGLAVAFVLSAGSGQVQVAPDEVIGSILHRIGLDIGSLPSHPQGENTLWLVRFPRVILGALVGASLGCAGALMQGVFGNPLAEPGIIGVSSGAAVGAYTVIVFGISALGSWTVAVAAFVCGLITTSAVYLLSRSERRSEVVTLILTGIAVNTFVGGLIGMLTFLSDDDALRQISYWSMGSMNGSTWDAVWIVAGSLLVGMIVASSNARQLDLLSLGERSARHLGVNIERLRLTLVVVVALLVGSGVAFTGIIGFVGLVVPHLIRMISGPAHRILIPGSALGGALVVVCADMVARSAPGGYQEIPLGVLTALVGGPFFFYLLRRTRRNAGGWA